MSRLRFNWGEAVSHLQSSCPRMKTFIQAFGSERLHLRKEPGLFAALSRAIAYQQLSGKAAGTIHGRFRALFPGDVPAPELARELSMEQLRGVGLSRSKSLSILDLAEKSMTGELPSPRQLGRMSDVAVIDALCAVRGIGPWTAQMYLMFNLGRPDIMPTTDLGVQKGVQSIYGLEALPAPADVLHQTLHLAPYRSVASWYFWRASETVI